MSNGLHHKTLVHFGKKIEGGVRKIYGFSGQKTLRVPLTIPCDGYHRWYEINFCDLIYVVNRSLSGSQLVEFMDNDLTQQEIDLLSTSFCPELPRVAEERLALQESMERRIEEQRMADVQRRMTDELLRRMTDELLSRLSHEREQRRSVIVLREVDECMSHTTPSFDAIPKMIDISKECCVCMEAEKLLLFSCHHVVCFECFQKIAESCPMCRVPVEKSMIKRL